ncbi:MAG: hypothetical protein IKH13_00180 [Clostridia bacterium]|nr:hypothetical protein [Clostridia bacterium]
MDNFITIGDTRLKSSNIKNYGISDKNIFWAHVYRYETKEKTYQTLFRHKEKTRQITNLVMISDEKDPCYKMMITQEIYEDANLNNKSYGRYFAFPADVFRKFKKIEYEAVLSPITYTYYCHNFTYYGEPCSISSDSVIVCEKKTEVIDFSNAPKRYYIEEPLRPSDVFKTQERYLYITTYQGDNFQFFEYDGYEIDKEIKRLDSLLSD